MYWGPRPVKFPVVGTPLPVREWGHLEPFVNLQLSRANVRLTRALHYTCICISLNASIL